jgi:hypothetical protein
MRIKMAMVMADKASHAGSGEVVSSSFMPK